MAIQDTCDGCGGPVGMDVHFGVDGKKYCAKPACVNASHQPPKKV